ncbi:uncharacterized protein LOC133525815 [Cydia pomonella]|uniref:uncharacterized protein LOC133525815 n=1 Tax=Cydia pomonella TaxID=82600 RepID=UPI002ADE26DA|nr:uncharacterized protein LOC133525815 [Cydia pomonella]
MSAISLSSPTMSDKTLLLSVEDLISLAMGPRERNTVNFKMIQTVLHILARQMRVLEQKVVLVAGDLPELRPPPTRRGRRRDDEEVGFYISHSIVPFPLRSSSAGTVYIYPAIIMGVFTLREICILFLQINLLMMLNSYPANKLDVYRRGTPPEFKSEEERIAWEKEQDELEERSRARSRRRQSSLDFDEEEDEYDRPGAGRGRRDDEPGGRGRSGRGRDGRGGADKDRSGGRAGRGRYGEDERGRDRSRRYDEESGSDGSEGRDEDGRRRGRGGRYSDEDEGGRGGRGRSKGRGGRDRDEEDDEGGRGRSRGRGGKDRDEDDEGGRGRSRGRGGRDRDGEGGRDRTERRGGREDEGSSEGEGKGGRGRDGRGRDGGRDGRGRDDAERGGKQGIGVREIQGPGKEKVLVVEKGPTTIGSARDRDSIAVVTQSQFQLLEAQVEELLRAAGPLPELTMPDNKQLRQDLAAGASLTDAMQAMQVSARVQAAEQAIMKLGGLLTQLAASGALPPDAAGAVMAGGWADEDEALIKSTSLGTAYQSVRIDPSAKDMPGGGEAGKTAPGGTGVPSKGSVPAADKFVTKPEMNSALTKFRDEVTKSLQGQIDKAATAAENAEKTAKTVGEKMEELLKMDSRLTTLHSTVEDYTEQLNGFDAGLTTQMASFKEQMSTMRAELQGGLEQLEVGNSNPETAAVMELNERFEDLVRGLDDTLLQHTALSNMQHQLTLELKTLVEGVEMLREQKADRDELLDILRDKADISMLDGLVRQEEFERAQADLEQRLDQCNDKFKRQDEVWMDAIRDLRELADTKAQMTELLKIRDEATTQLLSIDERINRLALILGEPKAAMLMRKLARDAVCGSCLTPAMMHPGADPMPPALPAAHGPAPPPCPPEPRAPDYPDFRTHKCHRWVGGSHTLLPPGRVHAAPIDLPDVTKKYTGYGDDGRLYWMETPMEPCAECNPEPAPAPPGTARSDGGAGRGGGDAAPTDCAC